MTRSFELGRDNFTRRATVILDEKFDSEHFYIGEGMIPSGNWSGYPPHRHDVDNPPEEIDMEETYFYLFNPPQGFGIQKIYTPDGRIDETYTVRNYDTVAIAEGYHPLCGAPGYDMYYLWTMCGQNNRGSSRRWIPRINGWWANNVPPVFRHRFRDGRLQGDRRLRERRSGRGRIGRISDRIPGGKAGSEQNPSDWYAAMCNAVAEVGAKGADLSKSQPFPSTARRTTRCCSTAICLRCARP